MDNSQHTGSSTLLVIFHPDQFFHEQSSLVEFSLFVQENTRGVNLMWLYKSTIDSNAIADGGAAFASDQYWSSTERFSFD